MITLFPIQKFSFVITRCIEMLVNILDKLKIIILKILRIDHIIVNQLPFFNVLVVFLSSLY